MASNQEKNAALRDAAEYYDLDLARSLIRAGADINAADQSGRSPLHLAACDDYQGEGYNVDAMIDLLIENGANVNAANSEGWTPLHYAVHYFDQSRVARLIHAGANVTLRDDEGQMPIHIPLSFGRINDVQFLVQFYEEHDIDIFVACMLGRLARVVRILDEDPSLVNLTDDYGSTPLMEATVHNQTPVVKLLLERGARPNVQNQGGITALHVAKSPAIIEALLSCGADPTIQDSMGARPSLP